MQHGSTPIASGSSITKWNVLALVTALLLLVTTLGLDQVWLRNWAQSGVAFPIGQRASVTLPAGQAIVYYESPIAVPVGDATLRVVDGDGERMPVSSLPGDMNYRLLLSGWSGRALWQVDVAATGTYDIVCHNHSVLSDTEIPAEDRVVFLKEPASFHEVSLVRTFIQVTGATLMITSVIVLYALHCMALRKRRGGAVTGHIVPSLS